MLFFLTLLTKLSAQRTCQSCYEANHVSASNFSVVDIVDMKLRLQFGIPSCRAPKTETCQGGSDTCFTILLEYPQQIRGEAGAVWIKVQGCSDSSLTCSDVGIKYDNQSPAKCTIMRKQKENTTTVEQSIVEKETDVGSLSESGRDVTEDVGKKDKHKEVIEYTAGSELGLGKEKQNVGENQVMADDNSSENKKVESTKHDSEDKPVDKTSINDVKHPYITSGNTNGTSYGLSEEDNPLINDDLEPKIEASTGSNSVAFIVNWIILSCNLVLAI